jgi:hypothetical protein
VNHHTFALARFFSKLLEDFERAGVVGLTILPAVEELKAAARRLLVEIMGVEERS